MIKAIKRWRKAHRTARYMAGFDWAAGQLLRGETADYVQSYVDNARAFEAEPSWFDTGAEAAISAWAIVTKGWGK